MLKQHHQINRKFSTIKINDAGSQINKSKLIGENQILNFK